MQVYFGLIVTFNSYKMSLVLEKNEPAQRSFKNEVPRMQEIGVKLMWYPNSKKMSIEIDGRLTINVDTTTAMSLIRKAIDDVERKAETTQGC
jgi:hypothetical protein